MTKDTPKDYAAFLMIVHKDDVDKAVAHLKQDDVIKSRGKDFCESTKEHLQPSEGENSEAEDYTSDFLAAAAKLEDGDSEEAEPKKTKTIKRKR